MPTLVTLLQHKMLLLLFIFFCSFIGMWIDLRHHLSFWNWPFFIAPFNVYTKFRHVLVFRNNCSLTLMLCLSERIILFTFYSTMNMWELKQHSSVLQDTWIAAEMAMFLHSSENHSIVKVTRWTKWAFVNRRKGRYRNEYIQFRALDQ